MKTRLTHFDAIRGMTIMLVVLSHLSILVWNDFGLRQFNTVPTLFRLAMFFFISGYFAYSDNYTGELLRKRSRSRLISQFVPTVVLWCLFLLVGLHFFPEFNVFDGYGTADLPFDISKSGYWYTLTLVEQFFIVVPLLYLFARYSVPTRWRLVSLLAVFAVCYGIHMVHGYRHLDHSLYNLLGLNKTFRYMLFFIMGMIAKMYQTDFHRLASNFWVFFGALTVFVLFAANPPFLQFPGGAVASFMLGGLSGIMVVTYLFIKLCSVQWTPVQKVVSLLSIAGTSTLEIYLLHWFIIGTLAHFWGEPFALAEYSILIKLPFAILTAIFITWLIIMIVKGLKAIHVYQYIFPKPKKKKDPQDVKQS